MENLQDSMQKSKSELQQKKKMNGCLKALLIATGVFFLLLFIGVVFGDDQTEGSPITNDSTIVESTKEASNLYEENKDYEILYCQDMGNLKNYYVLLLWDEFDKESLGELAQSIKEEKSPNISCNVHLYDSREYVHLYKVYPLRGKDLVNYADHLVFTLTFDGMPWANPLVDECDYKKFGGTKTRESLFKK